jgi:hypothetical protein
MTLACLDAETRRRRDQHEGAKNINYEGAKSARNTMTR